MHCIRCIGLKVHVHVCKSYFPQISLFDSKYLACMLTWVYFHDTSPIFKNIGQFQGKCNCSLISGIYSTFLAPGGVGSNILDCMSEGRLA